MEKNATVKTTSYRPENSKITLRFKRRACESSCELQEKAFYPKGNILFPLKERKSVWGKATSKREKFKIYLTVFYFVFSSYKKMRRMIY